MRQIDSIRCTHVAAQVNLGYYDADGNLVGEETFPQSEGKLLTAHLFHPHCDQLTNLIDLCIQQAWELMAAKDEGGDLPRTNDGIERGEEVESGTDTSGDELH